MVCVFIFTDINPNRAVCGRHISFTTRKMLNTWHGKCSPSGHHNPHSRGAESSPRTTVCKPLTCNTDRGAARFSCCVAWHAKWKTCHHQWVTGHLKWAFPREVTAPTHCASLIFFNPFIEVSDRLTLPFHLHYKYECNIRGAWDQLSEGERAFSIFSTPVEISFYTYWWFSI